MDQSGDLRVSRRGQMSLPATARRRWGMDEGGEVGFLDLGDVVVLTRTGIDELRRQLIDAVGEDDWAQARSGFGDDELSDE